MRSKIRNPELRSMHMHDYLLWSQQSGLAEMRGDRARAEACRNKSWIYLRTLLWLNRADQIGSKKHRNRS